MAKVETYKCDVCGIQKQDSNHWWRAFQAVRNGKTLKALIVVAWNDDPRPRQIQQVSGENDISFPGEVHLCGHECVVGYLSKNLLST